MGSTIDDRVAVGASAGQAVRRVLGERLVHRHVDPYLGFQRRTGRNRQLEPRAETGAGPRDRSRTGERHVTGYDHAMAEQIDLELARVQRHQRFCHHMSL